MRPALQAFETINVVLLNIVRHAYPLMKVRSSTLTISHSL